MRPVGALPQPGQTNFGAVNIAKKALNQNSKITVGVNQEGKISWNDNFSATQPTKSAIETNAISA
jgi:biopolymer transport protein ExbD